MLRDRLIRKELLLCQWCQGFRLSSIRGVSSTEGKIMCSTPSQPLTARGMLVLISVAVVCLFAFSTQAFAQLTCAQIGGVDAAGTCTLSTVFSCPAGGASIHILDNLHIT